MSFKRYDSHKHKRLSESWRRPKGRQNKLRKHIKAKGPRVSIGHRSPKRTRNRHPCGLKEKLVYNVEDLETDEPVVIRVASKVGMKKRIEIESKAEELGLKVLNPIK